MTTVRNNEDEALREIMKAAPLYERYLQIARINEVRVERSDANDMPEFFAPAPTPTALALLAR